MMREREKLGIFGIYGKRSAMAGVQLVTSGPIVIPDAKGRAGAIKQKFHYKLDKTDFDLSFMVERIKDVEYWTYLKLYPKNQQAGWALRIEPSDADTLSIELSYYELSMRKALSTVAGRFGMIALGMASGGYNKGFVRSSFDLVRDSFNVMNVKDMPMVIDREYRRDASFISSGITDVFESVISPFLSD